jgi:hypothetical protein
MDYIEVPRWTRNIILKNLGTVQKDIQVESRDVVPHKYIAIKFTKLNHQAV